eukprot:5800630-Prymnesium_polylepis.1
MIDACQEVVATQKGWRCITLASTETGQADVRIQQNRIATQATLHIMPRSLTCSLRRCVCCD